MPDSIHVEGDNNLILQNIKDSTITVNQNSVAKPPKDLTLRIPKIHISEVIGRESELEDLHKLLFDNKHVVVVNGLGGIGKTTLAQAYMSLYYDDYQHIAWISQSSESTIESDFVNTDGLKENLKIETQGKDLPMLFNEVLLGLKTLTDKPNLLLIDNAESSLTQYFDRLPNQPNWHLLVTSREYIERFYPKELGFLTPEKALELFQKYCTLIKDEVAINELLHIVDYHTLTIEILAKTAQKLNKDIYFLKTAIENDSYSPVFINHKGKKIDKIRTYLCSIFDLSKLNERETWLMKQFACLPSEFLSYDFFIDFMYPDNQEIKIPLDSREFIGILKRPQNFQDDILSETLCDLVDKGWIIFNNISQEYKMHKIISDVVTTKLSINFDDTKSLIKYITQKLHIDQSKDNPLERFQWIIYGKVLLDRFAKAQKLELFNLQNNLAHAVQYSGDYKTAIQIFKNLKESSEEILGEYNPTTMVTNSNLSVLYRIMGDYSKALKLSKKATFFSEKEYGMKHSTTAITHMELGLTYRNIGDLQKAKESLEIAIQIFEGTLSLNHPNLSRAYSNLATILSDLNEFFSAKLLMEKAINISEIVYGLNHITTITNYANLSSVLKELGDYKKAKELNDKVVAFNVLNLGEKHPNTAISYSNLSNILIGLKDYSEALFFAKKALNLSLETFGEFNPTTAQRYHNLSTICHYLGENQDAIIFSNKAMSILETIFSENHPTKTMVLNFNEFLKTNY